MNILWQQKVLIKEQEIGHLDYTYAVDLDFDCKCIELRQEYERRFNDVRDKYDLKMKKLRQEMEDQRVSQIKLAEELKNEKILALTKEHSRKYTDIKNYYSDITATNLDMIKSLKNEINSLLKNEDRDRKILQQLEKQNKELKDPIKSLNKQIEELLAQKNERSVIEQQKFQLKKKIAECETRFRKSEYEYECKLQDYNFILKEKNALFKKFNELVYGLQQKIGLKNLILEKRNENIVDYLEIKDLELNQFLKCGNLLIENDKIEDIQQKKEEIVRELENSLIEIRKAHAHMVRAYENKLSEFVIPVEELGFDPLVPSSV